MGRVPGRERNGSTGVDIRPSDLDQMSYRAGSMVVEPGRASCPRAWQSNVERMTRTVLPVFMPTPVAGYEMEGRWGGGGNRHCTRHGPGHVRLGEDGQSGERETVCRPARGERKARRTRQVIGRTRQSGGRTGWVGEDRSGGNGIDGPRSVGGDGIEGARVRRQMVPGIEGDPAKGVSPLQPIDY